MSHSFLGITLDIIDYYPIDYDYSTFSFIFISEAKDFEREISYINSNQICQKVPLNKKDIKYSIKITKDDSFIGISEFIIPYQIINKKEKIYDKVCLITMTDSIKKLLFGSISNYIPLKIGIHATLQYIQGDNTNDKSNKKEKLNTKQKKKKDDKINSNSFTPKKVVNKDKDKDKQQFNAIRSSYSGLNNKINSLNSINVLNNSITTKSKKGEAFFSHIQNNKTFRGHQRAVSTQRQNQQNTPKVKSMKNTFRANDRKKEIKTEINEENESEKKINLMNKTEDEIKIKKNEEKEKDINYKDDKDSNKEIKDNNNDKIENGNNNDIDEVLNKKDDNSEAVDKLKNNMNEYIDINLNKELNDIKENDDMRKYTKDNLNNLLNYHLQYYELINKEFELGNKYNDLLLEYNEKYRTNLARINKLKEENDYNQIKKEMLTRNNNINDNDIINLKNKELNIFNDILSNLNNENNKDENNNNINKNDQFLLLFKVLKKINNKHGPLENLLNQSNSTEPQRIILRKILNKYNKELELSKNNNINNNIINRNISNEINNSNNQTNNKTSTSINNILDNSKKNEKLEHVSSAKPDNIDIKIDTFLKQYYLKHNIPKIIFKKTSKNNYEYGTQKIMIKLEGEIIRVRYSGGYLLLDKFVELNAPLEENKKKMNKTNDNNPSNKNIKKRLKNN